MLSRTLKSGDPVNPLRRLAPFAALLIAAAPALAQSPSYHVARQITIGGEGGWDYLTVDAAARRLYISHATHVQVVDLAHDSVIGDIPNTPGVHGIAVAADLGKGFISSGRDSSVTIFDLTTLAPTGRLNVGGRNPDAIVYDAVTRRVFTMNAGSGTATAIDATNGTVLGMVTLGGRPEFAVADGRGRIFVNLEDSSAVVSFDARTLQLGTHWSILPCEGPSGLAMDRQHRRLFSVCNGTMAISDADAGRVVTTVPIGTGVDGVMFDPGTLTAFSSNGGDSSVTAVHEDAPDRYSVVQTIPTKRGARTIAIDERSHRLYLPTAEFGPPPPPTAAQPRPRPTIVPGSFMVLVLER
jgi:DNA-binding beta-propeller fold protein YncE